MCDWVLCVCLVCFSPAFDEQAMVASLVQSYLLPVSLLLQTVRNSMDGLCGSWRLHIYDGDNVVSGRLSGGVCSVIFILVSSIYMMAMAHENDPNSLNTTFRINIFFV